MRIIALAILFEFCFDNLGNRSATFVMPDPFKLFGRLFVATLKILGYFFVFVSQVIWYILCRQPVRIGDAVGYFGRSVVDTLGEVLR